MANKKLLICFLQKTYHVNVKMPFPLVFITKACEAYSSNIYIPATVELTNIDQMLTLHKQFLGFNLTYMNITDYQFMPSLCVTKLISEQLVQLTHKLPNYTMVNYNSWRNKYNRLMKFILIPCLCGFWF